MDDLQFAYRLYKIKEKEWLEEADRIRLSRKNRSGRKLLHRWICFMLNHIGNLPGSKGLSLQNSCKAVL